MATPENVASEQNPGPDLRLLPGGLLEVITAAEQVLPEAEWAAPAQAIKIEKMAAVDEEGQTHVMKYDDENIGAAGVFTRSIPVGKNNGAVHAAEIEIFATNEVYYHSAYLALVRQIIESDPYLTVINGAPGPEMAAVASDLVRNLPQSWISEYILFGGRDSVEVSTFNPDALAAHIGHGGKAEHNFKKLA